jgi:hypothetical protein
MKRCTLLLPKALRTAQKAEHNTDLEILHIYLVCKQFEDRQAVQCGASSKLWRYPQVSKGVKE